MKFIVDLAIIATNALWFFYAIVTDQYIAALVVAAILFLLVRTLRHYEA